MVSALTEADVKQIYPNITSCRAIGAGGFKSAYLVRQNDGIECALKLVDLGSYSQEQVAEVVARIGREVDIINRCQSDYLVKPGPIPLHSTFALGRSWLIFSEQFVDGVALNGVLQQGRTFTYTDCWKLARHVTDAIGALWQQALVHRDIKPANIIQHKSGDFILLDTGLAFDHNDDSLSLGAPVGTPGFHSPEHFDFFGRRQQLDCRSDLYCLAITVYVLCARAHPFYRPGQTVQETLGKMLTERPPKLSSLRKDIPENFAHCIDRMLNRHRHSRFRNCDEVIKSLEQCRP